MVHSVVRWRMRSAGFEVLILALRTSWVVFGPCTVHDAAEVVILSAGRLDTASALKPRVINMNAAKVRTASNAATETRRAVIGPAIGESPSSYPPASASWLRESSLCIQRGLSALLPIKLDRRADTPVKQK